MATDRLGASIAIRTLQQPPPLAHKLWLRGDFRFLAVDRQQPPSCWRGRCHQFVQVAVPRDGLVESHGALRLRLHTHTRGDGDRVADVVVLERLVFAVCQHRVAVQVDANKERGQVFEAVSVSELKHARQIDVGRRVWPADVTTRHSARRGERQKEVFVGVETAPQRHIRQTVCLLRHVC